MLRSAAVSEAELSEVQRRGRAEVQRRAARLRGDRPRVSQADPPPRDEEVTVKAGRVRLAGHRLLQHRSAAG